jgi:hypothetical protein
MWAIVSKSGAFVIRYDNPGEGHKAEAKDKHVWPLEREPDIINGEGVDFNTGLFDFSLKRVLPTLTGEVKSLAAARIEAVSPDWRQRNDLRLPSAEGEARFAVIDAIRAWSNEAEERLAKLASVKAVIDFRAEIQAWSLSNVGV